MQLKIFNIPLFSAIEEEDALNKFLRSHRILQVSKSFFPENGGVWTILVEYMDGDRVEMQSGRKNSRDYSKELSPQEYERYCRYKETRKELADAKNIPPYLIFTNEELAILSKFDVLTKEMLNNIDGIPQRRLRDYGQKFLSDGEEKGLLDGADLPY